MSIDASARFYRPPAPQLRQKTIYEMLEALIKKWEEREYTGDLTQAAYHNCAMELRQVLGKPEDK